MKNPINPPADRGPVSNNNPRSCVSKFLTQQPAASEVLGSLMYDPVRIAFSTLASPSHDGKPEVMCPSCALHYVLYATLAAAIDAHQSVTGYVITRTAINEGIAAVLDDIFTGEDTVVRDGNPTPPRDGGRK